MILKEQNNQKKTLTDGVLDENHEQEDTPSANGKVSQPWAPCRVSSPCRPVCVRGGRLSSHGRPRRPPARRVRRAGSDSASPRGCFTSPLTKQGC